MTETKAISNVVDPPVQAISINVAVVSSYSSVYISGFFLLRVLVLITIGIVSQLILGVVL